MAEPAGLPLPEDGRLAQNIVHFARALRKAGLPVGTGRAIDAIAAVAAAGFTRQGDFYWTLHACFVSRPEHRAVFGQVFRLFWRDPRYLEHMMSLLIPAVRGTAPEHRPEAAERRAAEALLDGVLRPPPATPVPEDEVGIEVDAARTMSREERLRQLDFEQMTVEEAAEARRLLARLSLPVAPLIRRRSVADPLGPRPDWRRTLGRAMRRGGEVVRIDRRSPGRCWPNLIVLCDISGSMVEYARAILQFVHAVAQAKGQGWALVHAFTFGTRLTNITRQLARRDVDQALAAAGAEAPDWSGGTRIGDCLHVFNRDWGRRVLGQGAVVLMITDGLDRDDGGEALLAREMERLHLSCRRLIWINPLLRWDGFTPRAAGIRAMLPHVDSFRPGHSIAALAGLAEALADEHGRGGRAWSARR
jgi:hypothetical protein